MSSENEVQAAIDKLPELLNKLRELIQKLEDELRFTQEVLSEAGVQA